MSATPPPPEHEMNTSQSPENSHEVTPGEQEQSPQQGSQANDETETNSQDNNNKTVTTKDTGDEPQESTIADNESKEEEEENIVEPADAPIKEEEEEEEANKTPDDSENMDIDVENEMTQDDNNNVPTQENDDDDDLVEMPETLDDDLMLPEFAEGAGTRKDRSLLEFLESMDQYTPIIPDQVTDYYLSKSGFETSDVRIKRLLALATQKFISDIATDAYQYSRIRSSTGSSSGGGGGSGTGTSATSAAQAIRASRGIGVAAAVNASGGLTGVSASGQPKVTLTMEDLASALAEYGVNVKRPDFYR